VRIISDICDTQERFAKCAHRPTGGTLQLIAAISALSPAKPFSSKPKYTLAAIFLPLILATSIVHAHWVAKVRPGLHSRSLLRLVQGFGAVVGFAFFGQPLFDRGLDYLNQHYPEWPQKIKPYLEIQK
jgi:hypothetical protein